LNSLEEIQRLQSLEPEWHASSWIPARKGQRAGGVHSEARAKERRRADFVDDAPFGFRGLEAENGIDRNRPTEVRQTKHDSVVGGLDLDFHIGNRESGIGN